MVVQCALNLKEIDELQFPQQLAKCKEGRVNDFDPSRNRNSCDAPWTPRESILKHLSVSVSLSNARLWLLRPIFLARNTGQRKRQLNREC
jgi:hypothetical protein